MGCFKLSLIFQLIKFMMVMFFLIIKFFLAFYILVHSSDWNFLVSSYLIAFDFIYRSWDFVFNIVARHEWNLRRVLCNFLRFVDELVLFIQCWFQGRWLFDDVTVWEPCVCSMCHWVKLVSGLCLQSTILNFLLNTSHWLKS